MARPGGHVRHDAPPQPAAPAPHPWDGFLTGPENELAFASVQALARGQGEGLSPLVIHGPSGTGKSRLLAGLAAEWVRRQPASAIAHVQGVEFAESCLDAARQAERDGWSELHDRFRTVDLLIIDDLEGLERVPPAQEELIHILDALEALGSAVAGSCHAPPGRWPRAGWPTRLISRFAGGLSVRIDPPGLASRRRHVLEAARARGLPLTAEASEWLASAADGYRTLDGWLARLALQGTPRPGRARAAPAGSLDLEAVRSMLAEETELAAAAPTIEAVAKAVARCLGVRPAALRGPGRQPSVARARHLAMHLARLHTGSSFAAIGAYFGGRDPATVRHACKAAAARLAADPSLAAALASLGPLR
jgi:chromosomal replication initiator protein